MSTCFARIKRSYLDIKILSSSAIRRPDAQPFNQRQPLDHPNKIKEITSIQITIPTNQAFSPAISAIQTANLVTFKTGKEHLAEIEFDRGIQGQNVDCRPNLPLQFCW